MQPTDFSSLLVATLFASVSSLLGGFLPEVIRFLSDKRRRQEGIRKLRTKGFAWVVKHFLFDVSPPAGQHQIH